MGEQSSQQCNNGSVSMTRIKIITLCFVILAVLVFRFIQHYQSKPLAIDGETVRFTTTLLADPKLFSNRQQVTARIFRNGSVFISLPRFPQYHYGETLLIEGKITIRELSNISTNNNAMITKNQTIIAIYPTKIELTKKDNFFLSLVYSFRQQTARIYERFLSPNHAKLLLGIVFGVKTQMEEKYTEMLQKTGVLHVTAASGMNVTLLGGVLATGLGMLFRRQVALFVSIAVLGVYAVIAGLEASILRATIMISLAFVAQSIGRQYKGEYGLFLAGLGLLVVSPEQLFDIGFQLSFLATAGILWLPPFFAPLVSRLPLKEEVLVTLAAQLATLPLLLFYFGGFSLWSFFANILIAWAIPPLMLLGGLAAVSGVILRPLGEAVALLVLPLLMYFDIVIGFFYHLPGFVSFTTFPLSFVVAYYCFLLSAMFVKKRVA